MNTSPSLRTQGTKELRPRDFQMIRDFMYQKIGVDLEGKEVLIAARIGKAMRESGIASFEQFFAQVQRERSGRTMTSMVDALVTNHTSFFREPQHFDFMRRVILPGLAPKVPIRIWSAACSSGEEPYSIAFTLMEELDHPDISNAQILATDISERVLTTARRGLYPMSRFEAVPIERLRLHMLKGHGVSEGMYRIKSEVRALIEFKQWNLMEDCSRLGKFSVIFCRNVMIYFDQATQQRVVNRLAAQLEPGGYLLIGHSESLNSIDHPLNYVCPATYRRPTSSMTRSSR